MTDKMKVLIGAIIAALVAIAGALTIYVSNEPTPQVSPSPSPSALPSPIATVSPSPSSTPSPFVPSPRPSSTPSPLASQVPSPQVYVLDTFERPEFAPETQWKPALTRTILDGQVTSIALKSSAPCALTGVSGLNVLYPYTTTKPSAPSYPLGTFYDAMKPIDATNCVGAKYLQIDLTQSQNIGGAQITIIKKVTKAPVTPKITLAVDFNNWDMVRGYCGGVYCSVPTANALQGLNLLSAHRISPYKGVIADTLQYWKDYTLAQAQGRVYMGWGAAPSWLSTAPVTPNAYSYIVDEPTIGSNLDNLVTSWAAYPWVKPMMTGPLKQRDYRAGSPTYAKLTAWSPAVNAGIKIFTVVAEQYCQETWAGSGERYACKTDYDAAGKESWLYVSNMSHGNDGGPATGAPDLVIDRTGVEPFGFFLIALKNDVTGLLYYDSIQGWATQKTRDVWIDAYQFGGQGDGLLLMPDVAKKLAYPTMRLKLLREASQFADIVILAGLQNDAKGLVTHTLSWQRDMSKIEALRAKALGLIQ